MEQKPAQAAPPPRFVREAPFLVELVDRQFELLSSRDADRLLMSAARVLDMLEREPTLAAILREFDHEVRSAVERYRAHETRAMDALGAVWRAEASLLLAHAGTEGFDREALEGYEKTLVVLEHLDYPTNEEPKWDRASSRHRLSKLKYWIVAARERATDVAVRARLANVDERLLALKEEHETAFREYRTLGVTLPGVARARLAWAVSCLNPGSAVVRAKTPPPGEARELEDLATMLHEPTKRRMLTNAPGAEIVIQARRDAELLREEILLALGRPRAPSGRLAHFVEKMRRFRAAELTRGFSAKSTSKASRELATRLAEDFFEVGLPTVATIDDPFAREAKLLVRVEHVPRPSALKVRATLEAALTALGAARASHGLREGVLVLVQTDGAKLVVPEEIRRDGTTLLVAVLDLGKPREKELHVEMA